MPAPELSRMVHRERVLLVGGGRALIMQLAHPAVAAAVAQHSDFPRGALARLRRTLDLGLAMVFGTEEEAEAAVRRIRQVHERVTGRVGGRRYRADDPRLLLWVHATLVDTTMTVYERFVRPLPEATWRRYYEETKGSALALGIPEGILPGDLAGFRAYLEGVLEGDDLAATDAGRRLVDGVLRPPLPLALTPAAEAIRLLTLALLPRRVRELFGLRAGPAARAALRGASVASRALLPLLPDRARTHAASRA